MLYGANDPKPNEEISFDHPLVEKSIVRHNLLIRYQYMPYCGSDRCMARVKYDMTTGVATCHRCRWTSSPLPKPFIDLYNQVWSSGATK